VEVGGIILADAPRRWKLGANSRSTRSVNEIENGVHLTMSYIPSTVRLLSLMSDCQMQFGTVGVGTPMHVVYAVFNSSLGAYHH
jgi:hypothetical protein